MLGAASVGLELDGLDESVLAAPPAVNVVVVNGAESGAMMGTRSAGAATADAGRALGADGADGSADAPLIAEMPPGDTRRAAADAGAGEGSLGEVRL
jgi:hypothetical protein